MSEQEALKTLLTSRWFFERCESANYHSLYGRYGFLAQLLEELESDPESVTRYSNEKQETIFE